MNKTKNKFNKLVDLGNEQWTKVGNIARKKTSHISPIEDYEDLYDFTRVLSMYAFWSAIIFGFIYEGVLKIMFFLISMSLFGFMIVQSKKIERKILEKMGE